MVKNCMYFSTMLIMKLFKYIKNIERTVKETLDTMILSCLLYLHCTDSFYVYIMFYHLSICIHICGRRQWHPTAVLLPGKSHGQRSQVGCSPWGREESGTTEWLHFHFSLSCVGEGNGNPLQCSCLENPRDGGAWWAAIYGVAQSRTQLKRLSSSMCLCIYMRFFYK